MKEEKKSALLLTTVAAWFTTAAYTVSPIDLIPDILPVLGQLDDLFGLLVVVLFTGYSVWRWKRQ
tara:strand:+ start:752 stop:946 length:195 start_codon:yes stop_codon:yes gene_type:complete